VGSAAHSTIREQRQPNAIVALRRGRVNPVGSPVICIVD
jgi:hypothetical protein